MTDTWTFGVMDDVSADAYAAALDLFSDDTEYRDIILPGQEELHDDYHAD